ncbi:MAG: dTDP-4-amino-4,6-dideoxygalactose transaminase [Bacteroidetes bacterium]|nr:dTDP-4-amino-4,6-dideoxygalactose transaminase [Bacteroidota bacterium]
MIPFNKPLVIGKEQEYLMQALGGQKFSGDGEFTKRCNEWIEKNTGTKKALLTTSCTHALEMAAILSGIQEGDEVIAPSFTFVSTANAFVLRGAKIIFTDIRPDTLNINEELIETAITKKTKAIVPVHYAGVSCEMDKILELASKYNLFVIEDAAQGIMSHYKGKPLGTIGRFGCFSFHETKNYHCGEGGALLVNDEKYAERAEIIREKGTNRAKFFRGQVNKYTWVDLGSSYLPGELNAAFLFAQLERAESIHERRLAIWQKYFQFLSVLQSEGLFELPFIPVHCSHNAHMFYIKLKNIEERQKLITHLKQCGIHTVFHYIPLHSSEAGLKFGRFHGEDKYTTKESERLLRLPFFYDLTDTEIEYVCDTIKKFFH